MNSAEASALIEAQPALQPGQPGWWRVWGASPQDIRPGDIVLTLNDTFHVEDVYISKSAPMRIGIIVEGERQTIGALCRIGLLRQGTHNMLSESVR